MRKKIILISVATAIVLAIGAGLGYYAYSDYYARTLAENGYAYETQSLCIEQTMQPEMKRIFEKQLTYSSSDETVFAVDASGAVTAVNPGEATLTASAGRFVFATQIVVEAHNYEAPTCEQAGFCRACGKTGEAALGHDYEEATCTSDAVCKRCEKVIQEKLPHSFLPATCTEDEKCEVCGAPGTEKAFGHEYAEATCETPEKCIACGDEQGEPLGHESEEPDCMKDTICHRCGKVVALATGEHDYAEATCKAPATCKKCGATKGKAAGHQYSQATCMQKATCSVCGATKGKLASHTYVETAKENNKITYTCAVCSDSYVQDNTPVSNSDWATRVVELVNAERANAGLGPLTIDQSLVNSATVRAGEIAVYFDHTRPNGRDCFSAFTECGVNYSYAGENIAAGQRSPEAVVEAWMNSSGHKANILSPNFTRIGVGYVKISGTTYVHYWVQNFAG